METVILVLVVGLIFYVCGLMLLWGVGLMLSIWFNFLGKKDKDPLVMNNRKI